MNPKLPAAYSAAQRALATAVRIEQASEVANIAGGMEVLAIKAKDPLLSGDAAELKVRATRKVGVLIKAEKTAGTLKRGARKKELGFQKPNSETLAKRGVDKNLAHRARGLEAMPEGKFEREVIKVRRLASAAAEGDREIVLAAKAERHQRSRTRRIEREVELAAKITAMPLKKYGVVYADPEWRFETYSEKGKLETSAENHYPTSELAAIKARDVSSICADDAVLFLWSTVPMQLQAYEVMAAWGFTYVSQIAWVKDRAGTGYWTRNRHELLLIGKRGKVPAPAMGTQPESVVFAPVGKHSEKPAVFYEIIETLFPNLPKIELNARQYRRGWDSWGTLEDAA